MNPKGPFVFLGPIRFKNLALILPGYTALRWHESCRAATSFPRAGSAKEAQRRLYRSWVV